MLTSCGRKTKKEKELREQAIGFMGNGDYGAAIARFNEALSMQDSHYGKLEMDILKYRAEAEIRNGDYAAADSTYAKLIEFEGESADYLNLRVVCISHAGSDLKKAIEYYHRAADKEGSEVIRRQALYALGSALAKSDYESYHEEAEAIYLEALEDTEKRSGELYNRMGMMCFEKGDYDLAQDYFNEGIKFINNSDNGEETDVLKPLKYNLAVCHEYRQEYEKALEEFKAYRDTYGSDEDVEHEIAFLETRVVSNEEVQ